MSSGSPPVDEAPGVCVFSGGTAANFLVDCFNKVAQNKKCSLTYIIPISDNGGSSSELIRVFGGPSEIPPLPGVSFSLSLRD
jgi:hypothetical protein